MLGTFFFLWCMGIVYVNHIKIRYMQKSTLVIHYVIWYDFIIFKWPVNIITLL